MKKKKPSFWKFYLVVALFPMFTACDGCIQLTGCNIDLGQQTGQAQDTDDTSVEQFISDLGK